MRINAFRKNEFSHLTLKRVYIRNTRVFLAFFSRFKTPFFKNRVIAVWENRAKIEFSSERMHQIS